MSLLDFILNIVALLLWVHWRSAAFPRTLSQPLLSLSSTLKPAGRGRARWLSLGLIAVIVVLRAIFYFQAGPAARWNPCVPLGAIVLTFRSDLPVRMFLFSALSFLFTLYVFYLWLIVLSVVNGRVSDVDPVQRAIRQHLGWFAHWPIYLRLLLPLLAGMTCWAVVQPLLARAHIAPPARSLTQLWQQAALIGLAGYLTAKFLVALVLVLHLVNSYIYLGNLHFWTYINNTARLLLRPLRILPLQFARVDFAPVAGIALAFLVAELAEWGLPILFQRL
jgi:uncharacterized protein YggT (Ycf19 family)